MFQKLGRGKKNILKDQLYEQQSLMQVAEKEIYENITQCLCLARLQLGNMDPDDKEKARAVTGEVNLLIGKAVRDLRNLAKQLSLQVYNQKH